MRLMLCLLALTGCSLAELETPRLGNCGDFDGLDNQWPVAAEPSSDLRGEGFELGDVVPDFRLTDQNGDDVCMWQFEGRVVALDVSTMWCVPCKELGCYAASAADDFGDDLVYLTLLAEGEVAGSRVKPEHAGEWSEAFELAVDGRNTPVVADPDALYTSAFVSSYPTVILVDRDLTVLERVDAALGDSEIRRVIGEAVGVSAPNEGHSVCE